MGLLTATVEEGGLIRTDLPPGTAVTVGVVSTDDSSLRQARLMKVLADRDEYLRAHPEQARSGEDILAELRAERDSWDD